MSIEEKYEYQKTLAEYKAASEKLKILGRSINRNKLREDYTLFEKIDKLKEYADNGEFGKAEKTARVIANSLTIDRAIAPKVDYNRETEEYRKYGGENYWPTCYGMGGIYIQRCNNVFVGALPKVGKTTFTTNFLIDNIMNSQKHKIIFFSLEMSVIEILIKSFCLFYYRVNKIRKNFRTISSIILDPKIDPLIYNAFEKFKEFIRPYILIMQIPRMTATSMVSIYEDVVKDFGKPDWYIVDYIQRMGKEPEIRKFDMRLQYEYMSQIFTDFAREKKINGLITSQLNKDGGLKESGAMDEDCAMSIRLKREEDKKDKLEIVVLRSRFCDSGIFEREFIGEVGAIG